MGQAIERLGFQAAGALPAIEIAIHLARYLPARQFCRDRTVLDIACGEGYGSFLMAERWGASRVHAVDISEEAILRAREFFASDRITFHHFGAEELDARFEPGSFDLVVCLETFEHVSDPGAMLRSFRRLLRPDGIALISCPNDYCYYGSSDRANPFHVRKYSFDDFRYTAELALGPAVCYMLGAPVAGYLTVEPWVGEAIDPRAAPRVQIEGRGRLDAQLIAPDQPADWTNCNYFLGVWGPPSARPAPTAVLYPINMHMLPPHRQAQFDALESARQAADEERHEALRQAAKAHEQAELARQEARRDSEALIEQAHERASAAERDARCAGLRAAALSAENEFIRQECSRLRHEMYLGQQREQALRERIAALDRDLLAVGLRAAALQFEAEFRRAYLTSEEYLDMRRRIENIDRLKRKIPRPVWNLVRTVFARR